ncbi:MAG: hypothetical protein M1834_002177 [Cirrosporium novae-zelandiae]|nr:MAG: hypothetical protein M1834_002177 [Cirrosporium novae-zelandiae]
MSSDNTSGSTAASYVDQAKGIISSGIGALTGNPADKAQAQDQKDKAAFENDLSHASAKVGPFSASETGAVTKDDPNRTQGSWNQTVGAAKESIGNLVGAEGLKQEGIEQNRQGKGQEAQGQLNDLGSGYVNRVSGAVGSAVAGLTGNKEAQGDYQKQHDSGKTQQRGAEADIQKQAGV